MKYFSMFSGIGGFEYGIQQVGIKSKNSTNLKGRTSQHTFSPLCVGYSEIDKYAIKVYERNFGKYESCDEHAPVSQKPEQEERPQGGEWSSDKHELQLHSRNRTTSLCNRCKGHRNYGDATKINPTELPDFDLLVGGFPCQAFSIAGKRRGFDDTRGTLFFDIARILAEKRPKHLVLENVKGLLSHDSGKTFQTILGVLSDLGYRVEWQVLNSKDFGVPQNRERVYFVGHLRGECGGKVFPITGVNGKNIKQVNSGASQGYRVYSDDGVAPTQASQAGGIGAKTGLVAVPKIRRLTPVECERLQGFPDDWTKYGKDGELISDTQRYKMCGNAVTTNVVRDVMKKILTCLNS